MPIKFSSCVMYANGKQIGEAKEIQTIDLEPKEAQESVAMNEPLSFSFYWKPRRMSRKKLVKRLMARGKSRNTANAKADTWQGNYADNYLIYSITGEII